VHLECRSNPLPSRFTVKEVLHENERGDVVPLNIHTCVKLQCWCLRHWSSTVVAVRSGFSQKAHPDGYHAMTSGADFTVSLSNLHVCADPGRGEYCRMDPRRDSAHCPGPVLWAAVPGRACGDGQVAHQQVEGARVAKKDESAAGAGFPAGKPQRFMANIIERPCGMCLRICPHTTSFCTARAISHTDACFPANVPHVHCSMHTADCVSVFISISCG